MTPLPSRDLSHPLLRDSSRDLSRSGANGLASSIRPISSPGLSPHDPRSTRILELRLYEASQSATAGEATHRDLAILQELDSHRYLDRGQIQALFFPGARSCQYRLRRLLDLGLVRAWTVTLRPGRLCRASVYLLSRRGAAALAEWREDDPRPYLRRAEHALERRFHLVHQLAANQFFVDLAAATRHEGEVGLYHWVGEHEIAAAYAEDDEHGPIPDGWGRLLLRDRELLLHLEWDRGTEQPRRLRTKLAAYQRYFAGRPHAAANQVLVVVPTDIREGQVRRLLGELIDADGGCQFLTTTADLVRSAGAPEAIWLSDGRQRISLVDDGGGRRSTPGLPRSERRIADSVGKPDWWLRRPAGGAGA